MKPQRKVTLHLPEMLLSKAQRSTGKGITETVRKGLQLVAASEAYEDLRKMRGKIKFSVNLKTLKHDRK